MEAASAPAVVGASIALVIFGAFLSLWAYTSLGSAQEVVAVRVDVARGEVITRDALQVVRVGVDPALQVMPGNELLGVIGQRASAGGLGTFLKVAQRLSHKKRVAIGGFKQNGAQPAAGIHLGPHVQLDKFLHVAAAQPVEPQLGMGVAAAGAVLAAFTDFFQPPGTAQTLQAFQATFACMGLITVASAGIFWQLSPQDRSGTQAGASVDAGDHG